MKKTSMTGAAGLLLAFASASHAQVGGLPSTYTVGWTSYASCNVGAALFTLPDGGAYYLPSTTTGSVAVGNCWYGSTNVLAGWLGLGNGYAPPPASFISGGQQSSSNDENSNEEPLTPNPHLVNSTDTQDPPGGGGGGNDVIVFEGAPVIPPTTTTPEPASLILVGSGLAGLAVLARRRRKR